ncbi:MAG: fatty acid desaturase [Gammaproteobacteria bacterium]|nr:fatty acid desaturase [Gammaproteobacteria bacterium]MBT8051837.1 fatty acid desaturase [Gammaproteobacteria bacterium]MBT8057822.1 fatty acid desaturase [Gammaproteobacteria bacterium]NNJ77831.1 acyl-CoA desaturase [Xanthomonadales bacterium]
MNDKENAPINWPVSAVLIGTFVLAVTVVPWYGLAHGYNAWSWIGFALLVVLNGIGIGSGYHRLWSHRTYAAHPALQVFLAVMGGMALQNSIIVWSARHRVHHRDVDDNDKDPYSIGRGFWFAHVGWMLKDYPSGEVDYSVVQDLEKNPVCAWQHRHYGLLVLATNVALPLFLGWLTGDILGMFLLAGVLRLVVSHHVTFFINSLAHIWGSRPYTDQNSARDNHLLALVTYGEGYHNYHHLFQSDYRCGIRWWHLDINKWFISVCALLGLAGDRKRASAFKVMRARLDMEFKEAARKLEQPGVSARIRAQFDFEYAQFAEIVKEWQMLQRERMQLQVDRMQQQKLKLAERFETETAGLTARYRELEASLKLQHKRLALLTAAVV